MDWFSFFMGAAFGAQILSLVQTVFWHENSGGNKEVNMAREKQGYRDALERIRHEAAGELVTVPEAAHIVYGTDPYAARKVCRNFEGWIGAGRDKRIPATALARQIC